MKHLATWMVVPAIASVTMYLTMGCPKAVEKGAVDVDANVQIKVQADVASPTVAIAESRPTRQTADTELKQKAARDAWAMPITIVASGGGWPLAGLIGLFLILNRRKARKTRRHLEQERDQYRGTFQNLQHQRDQAVEFQQELATAQNILTGQAKALAECIAKLPPGNVRDQLLALIKGKMPHRALWDVSLEGWGLRIRQRETRPSEKDEKNKT